MWCVNLGYSSKAIVRAVTEQLERLPYYPSFFNSTTEPAIRVAKFLAEKAPTRVNRTIFSNSGSEANETALKVIRAYWKLKGHARQEESSFANILLPWRDAGCGELTGLPNCQQPFDLPLADFLHVPGPLRIWRKDGVERRMLTVSGASTKLAG